MVAAETLATLSAEQELRRGLLFPSFDCIRDVATQLTAACARCLCAEGLGHAPADLRDDAWETYVSTRMYSGQNPPGSIPHARL